MPKITWKESILNHLKTITKQRDSNLITVKEFTSLKLQRIITETKSRTKYPMRSIDRSFRDLQDLNIIKYGEGKIEYLVDNHNEKLVYKEKRSNGHLRVIGCLDRLKISYEEEKTFQDLKHIGYLRLDVYFTFLGRKVAIEYDGNQHQFAVEDWGGDKALQETQYRDTIKDDYCRENRVHLYRINHEIKNIEAEVLAIVHGIVREHVYGCILVVLIFYFSKLN